MNTNILKPNSASRRWRKTRKAKHRNKTLAVRMPYFPAKKPKKPKEPASNVGTFNLTDFQRQAHAQTAVIAHEFHAKRGLRGAFGQSPVNRNPLTVAQRKAQMASA